MRRPPLPRNNRERNPPCLSSLARSSLKACEFRRDLPGRRRGDLARRLHDRLAGDRLDDDGRLSRSPSDRPDASAHDARCLPRRRQARSGIGRRTIRSFAARYQAVGERQDRHPRRRRPAAMARARRVDEIRRALASTGLRGCDRLGLLSGRRCRPRFARAAELPGHQGESRLPAAANGRSISPPAARPTAGRTSPTGISAAPTSRCSPRRSPIRAISRGRAALGRRDVQMRLRAINDVRKGQDPGTDWTVQVHADRPSRGELSDGAQTEDDAGVAVERSSGGPADRPGAAHLDPGLLRDAGSRRDRPGGDRRPAHGQGACQGAHGRRRGGGGSLSQRADAESSSCSRRRTTAMRWSSSSTSLSHFCDAGTKVIVCGKVNDIVLYRELIARGVSEYLVAPFSVDRFRAGRFAISTARRAPARSAASSPSSAPKAASASRRSRTMSPGPSPAISTWPPSSPISTSGSERPGSTTTRIRRRASPKRCSRPTASTPIWSIACFPNAATTSAFSPRPRRSTGSMTFRRPPSIR